MFKRCNSVSLLRLLQLAASKQGPEAEAASILGRYISDTGKANLEAQSCRSTHLYSNLSRDCWQPLGLRYFSKGSQAASSEEVDSASNKAERSGRKRRKKQDNSANGQPSASKAEAKLSKEAASLSKANGLFHAKLAAEHSEEKKLPSKKKVRGKSAAKAAGVGKDAKSTESSNTAAEGSEATKVPSAEATYRKFRKEVFKKQEQSLNESQGEGALREGVLQDALESFKKDSKVRDKALAVYVSSEAFSGMADSFADFVWSASKTNLLLESGLRTLSEEARMKYLFKMFAKYAVENHAEELTQYRDTINTLDLRKPFRWYPIARSLKRKFIYHAGPTNSGKTYTALQRMMQASSGVYCGPLRLLAMEVFDTCNAAGTFCNLVTGQEQRAIPGAEHTSCTIEMLDSARRVDVAVVDEVQLIGDDSRGWAWTKALLSLPANEIHLCGDSSAVDLVRKMAREMGEGFETREYHRPTPVQIEPNAMTEGYGNVKQGDCVVAFSRKAIYEVKASIERHTGLKACLIYGALPPETRRQQARLFNETDNEYDVLVASDAVGMGLNLNIRRIIFTTLVKNLGGKKKAISTSEIKQIAGRAGRRSSQFPVGYATCMNRKELPILEKAMATPMSDLSTPTAGLFPEFEHFEAFAGKALISDFSELIERFGQEARLDGTYFFCRQSSVLAIARLIQGLPNLSLKERFTFCNSPVNTRDPRQTACLLHFATRYARNQPVNLEVMIPDKIPVDADELQHMEGLHQVVSLWLWLSLRFDQTAFPNREEATRLLMRLIMQMDAGLQRLTALPEEVQSPEKLRAEEIAQQMKRPFLRNLCPEARMHQDREHAAKADALTKRLNAQIHSFKSSASSRWRQTRQSGQRATVGA